MELNRERERRSWPKSLEQFAEDPSVKWTKHRDPKTTHTHEHSDTHTNTNTNTNTNTVRERERERESFEIEKWKIKKREGVLSWWEFAGEREGDYRGERTGHGRILGEISGWPSTNFYYLLCLFGLWTPLPLLGLPS